MIRRILLVSAVLAAVPVRAELTGTGEFGFVFARGNSDSETANGRIELNYERERWTNEFIFSGVYARDSGETSSSRFVVSDKLDYSLDEHRYVLGVVRYDRDRFSTFRYQATAALGYGHRLIDSERHKLRVEAGPGFRYSEERASGESGSELIGRGFLSYKWQVSETTELGNRLLVEAASDNTFAENELSLSVAINSRLSLKAGVAVRHNTDVDPGRENTDTLTTLNLVYNLK